MPAGQATPTLRRIRAVVRGRVQGVAYRASTEREARRLGLAGWVENRADGAVALEAEGPADAVAALVAWCGRGPALARVTAVEVDEQPPRGTGGGFVVRR